MVRLFLFSLAATFLLSGCQSDPFFYKGWKSPQDGADERLYGTHGAGVPRD